ncbi:MAG: response regulator [Magnetococcales bacterium]|nr:response regulator [Magnetococcales bacterium]MBF0113409.1 response regulator [Magnetococcales bacterium]
MELPPLSLVLLSGSQERVGLLRRFLEQSRLAHVSVQVVGTVDDLALRQLQENRESAVLALEASLPFERCLSRIAHMHTNHPTLAILLLAEALPNDWVVTALQAGAQEMLTWSGLSSSSLERAILSAQARQHCLGAQIRGTFPYSKQARLLAESQQLARIGSWEFDLRSKQLIWSAEVFRIFEMDPDNFTASYEAFLALVHPEDRDGVNQAYLHSVNSRLPYHLEHRLQFADGRIKHVHERGETYYDESGQPLRSIGTVQDISDRKQAERRVNEQTARYHTLFQESPISLWEEDFSTVKRFLNELQQQGVADMGEYLRTHPAVVRRCAQMVRIVDVNQSTLRLYGAASQQEILANLAQFFTDETLNIFAEELIAFWNGQGMFQAECVQWTMQKKQIWVQIHAVVVAGYEINWGRVLITIVDLTDRKRTECHLLAAKQAAEAANQAKSEFLATMSHEIRTPMNIIMGMSEVLVQQMAEAGDAQQISYIHALQRNSNMLLELLNNLLDLTKLEAHSIALEDIEFDLEELMRTLVCMFQILVKEKGVRLEWQNEGVSTVRRHGDPLRLRQVLTNLLSNASKFTEQGSIIIRIEATEPQAQRLTFRVIDTGIGIAEEKQALIFELFQQADTSHTRKYGGTGLGLYLCKKIVELLGGDLTLCSRPGYGSTFSFSIDLPMVQDKPVAAPAAHLPAPGTGMAHWEGLRILLVEDAEDNIFLIKTFMRSTGVQLEIAENGQLAVERVKNRTYDLILMDIQMPVMDGYTATRAIRTWEQEQQRPPVPILALTAYALHGDSANSLAAGCNGHLTKPIRKACLFREIMATIQNQRPLGG